MQDDGGGGAAAGDDGGVVKRGSLDKLVSEGEQIVIVMINGFDYCYPGIVCSKWIILDSSVRSSSNRRSCKRQVALHYLPTERSTRRDKTKDYGGWREVLSCHPCGRCQPVSPSES